MINKVNFIIIFSKCAMILISIFNLFINRISYIIISELLKLIQMYEK